MGISANNFFFPQSAVHNWVERLKQLLENLSVKRNSISNPLNCTSAILLCTMLVHTVIFQVCYILVAFSADKEFRCFLSVF